MIKKIISWVYRYFFNGRQIRNYNRLVGLGTISKKEKNTYQVKKLKTLLSEVLSSIPYYQSYDIDLNNFDYNEFQKLPILTKDIIRKQGSLLINTTFDNSSPIYKNTSGGSTGEPVTFYQTKHSRSFGMANFYYANYLNGISPYDNTVDLWGAVRDMNLASNKFNMKQFLQNKLTLNTFVLDDSKILDYISILNKTKPTFIKAYVHSLYDISKYILANKVKIDFTPVIQTTTGPLYPEMRSTIRKAFNNAYIFSFYGSREVSAIATEIVNDEGMHVMFDNVLVEILDDKGHAVSKGEEGEIVITTLNNFYMPLIRYRIGDRGIKGDHLPFGILKIENVLGRTLGVIYRKDGGYVDGQFFTTLFFDNDGIKNFQLIQKNLDLLELRIIKASEFKETQLKDILFKIQEVLGDIIIEVVFPEKINLTSTGKIMYVYSELDSNKS